MNSDDFNQLKSKALAHLKLRREMDFEALTTALGFRLGHHSGDRIRKAIPQTITRLVDALAEEGAVIVRQRPVDAKPKVVFVIDSLTEQKEPPMKVSTKDAIAEHLEKFSTAPTVPARTNRPSAEVRKALLDTNERLKSAGKPFTQKDVCVGAGCSTRQLDKPA